MCHKYIKRFQESTAILSKKKKSGCGRGWCVRSVCLPQDSLPVKFQDVKVTVVKFKYDIHL